MEIIIRKAKPADAEMLAHYNAIMAKETEQLMLDAERLLSGTKELFNRPEYGFYLVAETDKTIIGQLMITYEWSDWRNGVFWWIQSVYVVPEFRSQGVFKKLFEYVLTLAKENASVCGLRLYVEKRNTTAHHVYEKLGMHTTDYELYETDFVVRR